MYHCSEFQEPSFLAAMSTTDNSELFLLKENQEEMKLTTILSPPNNFEIQDCRCYCSQDDHIVFASSVDPDHQLNQDSQEQETKKNNITSSAPGEKSETLEDVKKKAAQLGQGDPLAQGDDGFTTPTSLDQKIPVITQCPPAPKKTRLHSSSTRKIRPRTRRNLQLDPSTEFESMFTSAIQENIGRKIKKARTDEQNE